MNRNIWIKQGYNATCRTAINIESLTASARNMQLTVSRLNTEHAHTCEFTTSHHAVIFAIVCLIGNYLTSCFFFLHIITDLEESKSVKYTTVNCINAALVVKNTEFFMKKIIYDPLGKKKNEEGH